MSLIAKFVPIPPFHKYLPEILTFVDHNCSFVAGNQLNFFTKLLVRVTTVLHCR